MKLTYQDKGNYFRGLLILVGKDNLIHEKERSGLLKICHKLGYEQKYCENAIQEFLDNKFIDQSPPKFSTLKAASNFINDAINISLVDKELHPAELEWLDDIVKLNGIDRKLFEKLLVDSTLVVK